MKMISGTTKIEFYAFNDTKRLAPRGRPLLLSTESFGGSTWLLYSQYKAHVLGVQRSCTHSTKPMYYRRGKHLLQSTHPPAAIYTPSSRNLHTFQLQSTHPPAAIYIPFNCMLHTLQPQSEHLPAAIYIPSSRNLHTLQPQTAQTTFANSTPSCRGCDNFSDMVIVSVKRS